MHKVTLLKYVWNGESPEDSTEWVLFSQPLELPFVPLPGLTVQLPMQRSWPLQSITWVVESQEFRCYAEDQYMTDLDDYFEDWIEHLPEAGWKLEQGPHPKN
ncbi:hypothetical protein [Pseudomonas fluorescens]|uniref:hypothetical protein n=1 Tax=Pseudomonas fluorescens TaxID=294 RepID=UPI0012403599|nr:hypothetical protein [Pseudomonas fluorescens]VVN44919.1 hypothetical protein PS639_05659 [Pseudomonas fluorescens]